MRSGVLAHTAPRTSARVVAASTSCRLATHPTYCSWPSATETSRRPLHLSSQRPRPRGGVDRDVIVQGFDPIGYIRLGRSNELGRVAETAGPKALGINRAYRRALAHKTGRGAHVGWPTVLQRNAWDTGLPTGSFDFVYSLRTFMHIHDPQAALEESVRVLAPGSALLSDPLHHAPVELRIAGMGCSVHDVLAAPRGTLDRTARRRRRVRDLTVRLVRRAENDAVLSHRRVVSERLRTYRHGC